MPEGGPELSARVAEAAQRLTNGDIAAAVAALPEVSRHALSLSYADAFVGLLHVLIVITLLSAFATFAFLRAGPARRAMVSSGMTRVLRPQRVPELVTGPAVFSVVRQWLLILTARQVNLSGR